MSPICDRQAIVDVDKEDRPMNELNSGNQRMHRQRAVRRALQAPGLFCLSLLLLSSAALAEDDHSANDPAPSPAGVSVATADHGLHLSSSLDTSQTVAAGSTSETVDAHPQAPATVAAIEPPATALPAENLPTAPIAPAMTAADPVIKLGAGDTVAVQVYGRPEMTTSTYVADNGTIGMPLAGAVQVAGLSPADAANAVAAALRQGGFLVNPQVTVTLSQFRSQQISVLGEVKTPGRYSIESKTSVLDLLAQAGGETDNGADTIYVLRPQPNGGINRIAIDLRSLRDQSATIPTLPVRAGDSVYVPRADQYYIYGEVAQPNAYRLQPNMTVIQAVSRGGGITPRGSIQRIVISRRTADGKHVTIDAQPFDTLQADDVIRVKERIF